MNFPKLPVKVIARVFCPVMSSFQIFLLYPFNMQKSEIGNIEMDAIEGLQRM